MEETPRPPMIMPHLVGRASQLATLQLLVEQAKRGEGHLILISGEAGIGKSRLVAEVKTSTTSQGFLLLQGNCFPTDVTYPYAPLLDLLRSFFASHPAAPLGTELERLAHDLFPLLPELIPDQTMPLLPLEPEQEKRRLFAVLANFFLRLSASSPLLLVIEDVHWSDSTSLDFLHMLARRTVSQPLLLLVTYRKDEMRTELSSWLAQLTRERLAHEVRITPLARNEVDKMLSAIFEERHTSFDMRRFLHGELLEALYTLTEGTPFSSKKPSAP
jgi:predicted ATPase